MIADVTALLQEARSAKCVIVVHLACPTNVAAARLDRAPGDRASITGGGIAEELADLALLRTPRYRMLADFTIDSDGDPDTVAGRIESVIGLGPPPTV